METGERTRLLVGDEGMERLGAAKVAIFGLGGVGGAAAEALARAGVGELLAVDFDRISPSNQNRQLLALTSTVGRPKTEVLAQRLADAAPGCRVEARHAFFGEENEEAFGLERFDYVLDCIDSLNPKLALIRAAIDRNVPILVSAGAGGRTDPRGIAVSDLFATRNCPLARQLRKRLRRVGIGGPIPTIHTTAPAAPTAGREAEPGILSRGRPRVPVGSISYLPLLFGATMAGYVIRALLGDPLPLAPVERPRKKASAP